MRTDLLFEWWEWREESMEERSSEPADTNPLWTGGGVAGLKIHVHDYIFVTRGTGRYE